MEELNNKYEIAKHGGELSTLIYLQQRQRGAIKFCSSSACHVAVLDSDLGCELLPDLILSLMDPISAVGFAASLVTLLQAVDEGLRGVYRFLRRMKTARKVTENLAKTVDSLLRIVDYLSKDTQLCQSTESASKLQEPLQYVRKQLLEILQELKSDVDSLIAVGRGSVTGKSVRLGVKKFFMDEQIEQYERCLSKHLQTLDILLILSHMSRSQAISTQLLEGVNRAVTVLENPQAHFGYSVCKWIEPASSYAIPGHEYISQLGRPPNPLNAPNLAHMTKPATALTNWQWKVYRSALGTMSIGRAIRKAKQEDAQQPDDTWDVVCYKPPTWLADTAIYIFKKSEVTLYRHASIGFTWRLMFPSYNSNPKLLEAVNQGNVLLLQSLFRNHKAQPNDLIAPSGRSLIHMLIFLALTATTCSCEALKFLLDQKAAIDTRSLDGRTPLLLCCQLMQNPAFEWPMQEVARFLISQGADMSAVDPGGASACSMMFKCSNGVEFLSSSVSSHVDVVASGDLSLLDVWIFSAIATSTPAFDKRIRAEVKEFSTNESLVPRSLEKQQRKASPFDLEAYLPQIHESKPFRSQFVRSICRQGKPAMLEPLIRYGLDVNETSSEDSGSYLNEAVEAGNREIAKLLLDTGASVSGEDSALDTLIEKWKHQEEALLKSKDLEIFEMLLEHATERCPNALYRSITNKLGYCTRRLVEKKWMRGLWSPLALLDRYVGSEVMEAVKWADVATIELLLDNGASLDFEDIAGFTPLCQAVDKGQLKVVKCLLNRGARVSTPSSVNGITAYDLAKKNVQGPHPRRPELLGAFQYSQVEDAPSVEQIIDIEIHALIQHANLREEREGISGTSSQPPVLEDAGIDGGWLRVGVQLQTVRRIINEQMMLLGAFIIYVVWMITFRPS